MSAVAPPGYLSSGEPVGAEDTAIPDYFGNIGVRPFSNAVGPYSSLGGAEMWSEVMEAMDYAVRKKVRMSELQDAEGKRIASLVDSESNVIVGEIINKVLLAYY